MRRKLNVTGGKHGFLKKNENTGRDWQEMPGTWTDLILSSPARYSLNLGISGVCPRPAESASLEAEPRNPLVILG